MNRRQFSHLIMIVLVSFLTSSWLVPSRVSAGSESLPVTLSAKLIASDGRQYQGFGRSVAIDRDTIVAGEPDKTNEYDSPIAGVAYVYYRNFGGIEHWGEKKMLSALDGVAHDQFGYASAIDEDTIAIGAMRADISSVIDQGAVYIFERNEGGVDAWGQVKKITTADGEMEDFFGSSLALVDDTLFVGAYGVNFNVNDDSGAVYVFERNQGGANNWGQVTKILASDYEGNDNFGQRVAADGDILVVGAYPKHAFRGSAYVYYRNQGGSNAWGEAKILLADDAVDGDMFGYSIGIDDDVIVCGVKHSSPGGSYFQGAAYIFERNVGGADHWGQVKKLTASDGYTEDNFGNSVTVGVDTILVGANNALVNVDRTGVVYMYLRDEGGANAWGEAEKLIDPTTQRESNYSGSLDLDGETVVIASDAEDVNNNYNQGAAYVYFLSQYPLSGSGKQANMSGASRGRSINYTISLDNSSTAAINDVSLTDIIPDLLTYESGSLTSTKGVATYLDGVITWNGILVSDETVVIKFTASVKEDAPFDDVIINTAQIQGGGVTILRDAIVTVLRYQVFCPYLYGPCVPLYSDNFSNPDSGWPVYDDGKILFGYKSGEYRIFVRPADSWGIARPGFQAENFAVEVDLRNINNIYGSYGIAFGIAGDWSSFYTLEIYQDGWFGIYRYDPNSYAILAESQSSAIKQGSASNHIKVIRNGSAIEAYANGQLLGVVSDGTYTGVRYLGLVAASYKKTNVDIRFDNFNVSTVFCGDFTALSTSSKGGFITFDKPNPGGTDDKHKGYQR
jgi:uncharacterized repeat protein (TIGR01451 family)